MNNKIKLYGKVYQYNPEVSIHQVHDFLKSLPDIHDTSEVSIRLGNAWYRGVEYYQDRTPPSGARVQENYTVHGIYIPGMRPRKDRIVHYDAGRYVPCSNIMGLWYVGAYYEGDKTELQPFGDNFILFSCDDNFHPSGRKINMQVVYPGMTLRYLQDDKYTLIQTDYDLKSTLEYFGLEKYADDITGAIVEIGDGDYINTYFTESNAYYDLSAWYNHVTYYL